MSREHTRLPLILRHNDTFLAVRSRHFEKLSCLDEFFSRNTPIQKVLEIGNA